MENFVHHIEHREIAGGGKREVVTAVQQRDKEAIVAALDALDRTLTPDWPDNTHQVEEQGEDVEQFLKVLEQGGRAEMYIYLGDGGISRLMVKAEGDLVDMWVTNVSSNKVKQRFEQL